MGYRIWFLLIVFEDLLFFCKLDWTQFSYTLSVLLKFSLRVSSNYLAPTLQINVCHFSPVSCPRATENAHLPAQTLAGRLGCLVLQQPGTRKPEGGRSSSPQLLLGGPAGRFPRKLASSTLCPRRSNLRCLSDVYPISKGIHTATKTPIGWPRCPRSTLRGCFKRGVCRSSLLAAFPSRFNRSFS